MGLRDTYAYAIQTAKGLGRRVVLGKVATGRHGGRVVMTVTVKRTFWQAIEAMGERRCSPGEAVTALERFIIPASLIIIIALFSVQRHGTGDQRDCGAREHGDHARAIRRRRFRDAR